MSAVHPQVALLLERAAKSPLPPFYTVPPHIARRIYRDTRAAVSPPAPEVAESKLMILPGPGGPVAVRAYRPLGAKPQELLPALVFFLRVSGRRNGRSLSHGLHLLMRRRAVAARPQARAV